MLKTVSFTLLFFIITASWSLTTPIGSGPDEAMQIRTAYAVAHGQIGVKDIQVPEYVDALAGPDSCFAGKINQTADCFGSISTDTSLVPSATIYGTYFPAYYFIVGLPSLFLSGYTLIYSMRLMNALLFSIIIGISAALAFRKSREQRGLFVGLIATLTPMALFLGGVVNSSSFEIASAIFAWMATIHLFRKKAGNNSLKSIDGWTFAASSIILLSSRLLAPLWLLIIVVSVTTVSLGWRRLFSFLKTFSGIAISTIIITYGILISIWDLAHPNEYVGTGTPPSTIHEMVQVFVTSLIRQTADILQGAAGTLGWLDTVIPCAPILIYSAWAILVGVFLTKTDRSRQALMLFAVIFLGLVIPVALETVSWGGTGWQGRYSLPLLAGIPLLASSALIQAKPRSSKIFPGNNEHWGIALVTFLMAVTSLFAIAYTYHRYAVGIDAPFEATSIWHSPFGFWGPFILSSLAWLCILCLGSGGLRGAPGLRRYDKKVDHKESS